MGGITLVTGGAGFIGSHVVDALLTGGDDVRVLDDFSTGSEENLYDAWRLAAEYGGGLQVIEGDVRDEVRMRDAVAGCDAVVHLAAIPSVALSVEHPLVCNSVTHGGTVNALREAVDAEVPRFVLASSCAVYGDAAEVPVAETMQARPLSPYAGAKLASEEACVSAGDAHQITAVCLRFFNVFGPRQDPGSAYSGVISRFLAAAAAGASAVGGEPGGASPARAGVTIFGDGAQTRDFVYVGDVAWAIARALQRPLSGASVVNVGSGLETSLLQLVGEVEAQTGVSLSVEHEPAREGDIKRSCADVGRGRWVLAWDADTTLAEGLAETWEWYRMHADEPSAAAPSRTPRE